MSASIALVTSGGVVAASDSRASVADPRDERASDVHIKGDGQRDLSHVTYHVDGCGKVFAGQRACATWVTGNLDENYFRRLYARLSEHENEEAYELATVAHAFQRESGCFLQTLVAGYTDGRPALYLAGEPEEDAPRNVTNVNGRQYAYAIGRNEAFARLFGDVYVPLEGAPEGKVQLAKLESTIKPEKITLQAGIDFAIAYLEFCQHMESLRNRGHQSTGGPIDVAVTTAEGSACLHRVGTYGSQKTAGVFV